MNILVSNADLIYQATALFLGAMGALIMARAGVIDTGITMHFIFASLLFGYVGSQSVVLGAVVSIAGSTLIAATAFWVSHFNRRTYVLVLYVFSMISIPLGNLVLTLFPGRPDNQVTPKVELLVSPTYLFLIALIACTASFLVAHLLSTTRQAVLLRHWAQSSPAVAGDLQIAGVYSLRRIAWAATLPVAATCLCYFGAVVYGSFLQQDVYISGKFDYLPFWMLLIGLAAKERLYSVPLLVLLFTIAEQWVGGLFRESPTAPGQATFVVYGGLFLLFAFMGAKKSEKTESRTRE